MYTRTYITHCVCNFQGQKLIVYDVYTSSLEVFSSKKNVAVANSVKEVASRSSYVVTMLPDNDSVWSVYNDDDGILKYVLVYLLTWCANR